MMYNSHVTRGKRRASGAGTLTVVVGLCGSGKTWLLERVGQACPDVSTFDEGFSDRGPHGTARRRAVADVILSGRHVVVADLWCGYRPRRRQVLQNLRRMVPDVFVQWLWYENDLSTANHNCRLRTNKADAEGHVAINDRWSPHLTMPKGAVVFPIHAVGGVVERNHSMVLAIPSL